MNDLTAFRRDLLYVICRRNRPHGLALKDALEEYHDGEINPGRLYPNLDRLVEKGLVEKGQRNARTNVYTLTEEGRRSIQRRREWENRCPIAAGEGNGEA